MFQGKTRPVQAGADPAMLPSGQQNGCVICLGCFGDPSSPLWDFRIRLGGDGVDSNCISRDLLSRICVKKRTVE